MSSTLLKSFVVIAGVAGLAQAHIYIDHDPIELTEDEQQGIVATLTILLFVLMAFEITGPEVLFLIALMIVTLSQILTLPEALSGFSNESLITIGTLFLVVGAVERSHVVDWIARKTFGSEGWILLNKMRMYIVCFALSIFFNNTPLVAILLPVVKDWGRMRGVAASQLLIPLSYSVLAGSFGSMIGTSTNLTVQGLMQAERGYSFPFFAPMPIGIVCFIALLFYQVFTGPYLLPSNKSGLIREARDKADTLIAEVYVSEHSFWGGRQLGDMMNSLGVAPSYAIKIRRRVRDKYTDAGEEPKVEETGSGGGENKGEQSGKGLGGMHKSRSSSILDPEYLRQTAEFWLVKPTIPDTVPDYSAKDGEGVGIEMGKTSRVGSEGSGAKAKRDVEGGAEGSENFVDIIAPSFHEVLCNGDVVFIASAQDAVQKMMKSILGESRGLYILRSNVMALPGYGSEVVECVLSDSNPFVGKKVKDIAKDWGDRYNAGVITVRAKDWALEQEGDDKSSDDGAVGGRGSGSGRSLVPSADPELEMVKLGGLEGGESENVATAADSHDSSSRLVNDLHAKVSISEHVLQYGDVVLCVTSSSEVDKLQHNKEFFVVSTVGALPKPLTFYSLFPLFVFIVMLVLVASEYIEMCPAALTVTAFYFMGGWIKPEDIPKMVDIRLLMLMGASLSFARSMTKSGLALRIAEQINNSNPSNFGALLLVYVITLVITELISNNAAAALMYPIATALADELGASFKPFAMAVLVASTAGFMSPIGYQTHVMVWGPGGYRFRDFLLFGIVPDIIYWFLGCALMPVLFPF